MAEMQRSLLALLLGVLVCQAGCGGGAPRIPGLVPVSGNVTLNGQPLKEGAVTFVASDGQTIYSGLIANGRYTLAATTNSPGALPGEYRVAVKGPSPTMDAEGKPVAASDAVPSKFEQTATSGLSATVPASGGEIHFDLKP